MTFRDFYEKVFERIDRYILFPLLAKSRRKKVKCEDFTIISNNCWAGKCYEFLGMQKLTPTIGGYFFASDYVKFCKNLKKYLSMELEIIPIKESRHYDTLVSLGQENVIVGRLDDVEIVFLHYTDKDVVIEKWKRRVERVNWDKIILKFSYQNQCSDELLQEFLAIEEYPKFALVGETVTGHKDEIVFSRNNGRETVEETRNFNWYVDPIKILNDRL